MVTLKKASAFESISRYFQAKKRILSVLILFTVLGYSLIKPQQFINLWLTQDQQGQWLFNQGKYEQASKTFNDTHWKAYSTYANESFEDTIRLYSQFDNKEDLLAQANALAHQRNYIKARNLYQSIYKQFPSYEAAIKNKKIVQAIIDENNLLSASQQAEQGEASKELGDDPQSSDGDDRKSFEPKKTEKPLTAEQLLNDENLNTMWLRQVQKNPARFLSIKFYRQHEKKVNSGNKAQQYDQK